MLVFVFFRSLFWVCLLRAQCESVCGGVRVHARGRCVDGPAILPISPTLPLSCVVLAVLPTALTWSLQRIRMRRLCMYQGEAARAFVHPVPGSLMISRILLTMRSALVS